MTELELAGAIIAAHEKPAYAIHTRYFPRTRNLAARVKAWTAQETAWAVYKDESSHWQAMRKIRPTGEHAVGYNGDGYTFVLVNHG